eukprot:SAG22_NODE_300_length_12752_cov_3.102426_11_plen_97_part_00
MKNERVKLEAETARPGAAEKEKLEAENKKLDAELREHEKKLKLAVMVFDTNCLRWTWWTFWRWSQSLMAFWVGASAPYWRLRLKYSLSRPTIFFLV